MSNPAKESHGAMITKRCRHRPTLTVLLLLAVIPSSGAGQDKEFSGPQPGEPLSPFRVVQVHSPEGVKEVEIASDGDNAALLMFMHKLSEPAIGLMITIEWYVAKQREIDGHYIMLTDDRTGATTMAQRWAKRPFFSNSPMSISLDGMEGPGRYGLNRHVDMTVLVSKDNQVVHNFAINGPNNTDAPEILAAIAKTIEQPTPSHEKIRAELRAQREQRRQDRLQETPLYKLAPHAELGRLMVAMANRERATQAAVTETSAAMVRWAGEDKEKQASLIAYARKVLKGNFQLNRYAKEALEELVSE